MQWQVIWFASCAFGQCNATNASANRALYRALAYAPVVHVARARLWQEAALVAGLAQFRREKRLILRRFHFYTRERTTRAIEHTAFDALPTCLGDKWCRPIVRAAARESHRAETSTWAPTRDSTRVATTWHSSRPARCSTAHWNCQADDRSSAASAWVAMPLQPPCAPLFHLLWLASFAWAAAGQPAACDRAARQQRRACRRPPRSPAARPGARGRRAARAGDRGGPAAAAVRECGCAEATVRAT